MQRNKHDEDYLWNLGVNGRIILEWMLNVWAGREWYGLVWLLVGTTGEKVSSINYVESLWRTAVRVVVWLFVFMRGFCPNWPQRLAFCRQPLTDSWKSPVEIWWNTRAGMWSGKMSNAVGSQYPWDYLGTCCIQHYNRWWHTSAASSQLNWRPPKNLKKLRFAQRRNLVSPCVSLYFKCSLHFDGKRPQPVSSLCSYVMRRLAVRFLLRLEFHEFALRTRIHSSSSCPYFHLPHVSVQILSTQHHCGRYRIVLSLLVCV